MGVISILVASELILPEIRTRQCRVPTIDRGRETALPCPLLSLPSIAVGTRHCRLLYIIPAQPELILQNFDVKGSQIAVHLILANIFVGAKHFGCKFLTLTNKLSAAMLRPYKIEMHLLFVLSCAVFCGRFRSSSSKFN